MAIQSGARNADKSQGLSGKSRKKYELPRDVAETLLRSPGGSRHVGGWFLKGDHKARVAHLRRACEAALKDTITVLQRSRIKAVLLDIKTLEEES